MTDSINWKDKDSLYSKEEPVLDNSVKLTINSYSLNNCTKTISYKSTSVSSNDAQSGNFQSKYLILDNLGVETSSLQDNCIDTISLQNLMKEIVCAFKGNNTQMNVESWNVRGNKVVVRIPRVGRLRYEK